MNWKISVAFKLALKCLMESFNGDLNLIRHITKDSSLAGFFLNLDERDIH